MRIRQWLYVGVLLFLAVCVCVFHWMTQQEINWFIPLSLVAASGGVWVMGWQLEDMDEKRTS